VGNWQRIAGIGSDQAAYPRIYNPVRQALLFDSQATYIRRHCKELAKLPTRAALAPWEIGKQQQMELGFFTPQQYPAPVVDHEVAARAFLARYQSYRNRAS
jgi:deoxyribodipyrimidine photo-lyase